MQRFLQHVLPRGFVKVRYYGFFGATLRTRLQAPSNTLVSSRFPSSRSKTFSQTTQTPAQSNILYFAAWPAHAPPAHSASHSLSFPMNTRRSSPLSFAFLFFIRG